MSEEELTRYGWLKDKKWCDDTGMCWRDPMGLVSWYTFKDAVAIQEERQRRKESL